MSDEHVAKHEGPPRRPQLGDTPARSFVYEGIDQDDLKKALKLFYLLREHGLVPRGTAPATTADFMPLLRVIEYLNVHPEELIEERALARSRGLLDSHTEDLEAENRRLQEDRARLVNSLHIEQARATELEAQLAGREFGQAVAGAERACG